MHSGFCQSVPSGSISHIPALQNNKKNSHIFFIEQFDLSSLLYHSAKPEGPFSCDVVFKNITKVPFFPVKLCCGFFLCGRH